jgi:hypothetical protein
MGARNERMCGYRHFVAVNKPPMMQPRPTSVSQLFPENTKLRAMIMTAPRINNTSIKIGTQLGLCRMDCGIGGV